MINILQNGLTAVPVNKTMRDYCMTIPSSVHNCFNFAPIRNGGTGDDIEIVYNNVCYKGHVNAKHVERNTPAYQVSLPSQLRSNLVNSIANSTVKLATLNLRIDAIDQKLYLI